MKISRSSFAIAALSIAVAACRPLSGFAQHAQLPTGSLALRGSTTVPLVLSGNHVFIEAHVDKTSYAFLFDSGGTAILTPSVQRAAQFEEIGHAQVVGTGKEAEDVAIVRVPALRVGSATYAGGGFLVMDLPFPPRSPLRGLPFGGVIGREFLHLSIVTVNYEMATLTLTEPVAYHPDPRAIILPLTVREGHPNVRAAIDGHAGNFDVDTGNDTSATLTPGFAAASGLDSDLVPQVDAVVGRGAGGMVVGKAARASDLRLGSATLRKPVVLIAHVSSGIYADPTFAGALGGSVLRRFTLTIDELNSVLYLRPNQTFDAPFVFNRAGLFTYRTAAGEAVALVVPHGPAARHGVRAGDVVKAIDGRNVSHISHDELNSLLRGPRGTKLTLKLLRNGKIFATGIVLRDLI